MSCYAYVTRLLLLIGIVTGVNADIGLHNISSNNTNKNLSSLSDLVNKTKLLNAEVHNLKQQILDLLEPGQIVYIDEHSFIKKLTDKEYKREKEELAQEKTNRYNLECKNLSNVIESLTKSGATEELLKVADDNIENLFTGKSINFSKVVNKYTELKDFLNSGNTLLNELFLATYAVASCSKAKKMGLAHVFSYNEEIDIWENYIVAKNNPQLKGFKYNLGIGFDKYEFVLNREVLNTESK